MTNDQAATQLKKIMERIERARASVQRKRSWRDSEKAMAVGAYSQELEALKHAYKILMDRGV